MVLDEIVCHKMNVKQDDVSDCKAKDYHLLPNDDALREIERLSSTVIRRPRPNKHTAILEQQKASFFICTSYAAAKPIEVFDLLIEE